MVSVESTNKKRLKLNNDNDDDSKEDEIDLSKGEDRENYIAIQEGINNKLNKYFFNVFNCFIILEKIKQKEIVPKDDKTFISYRKLSKHYLNDHLKEEHNNLKMTVADYHKTIKILVTGFSNGSFLIFETVGLSLIHSLKLV